MKTVDPKQFFELDIRKGTIIEANVFPEARKPAYQLKVDFGPEIGIKKSSAQITALYSTEELVGKAVMAVVNFPPKQIGPFLSACLVLGFETAKGVVLATPDQNIDDGTRLS